MLALSGWETPPCLAREGGMLVPSIQHFFLELSAPLLLTVTVDPALGCSTLQKPEDSLFEPALALATAQCRRLQPGTWRVTGLLALA